MRVVIDGLPIRGDNSLSIVAEHLLEGWDALAGVDEVHLVVRAGAISDVPDSVVVHEVRFGRIPFLSRLRAQSFLLPRLCRSLGADVLLGVIPATNVTPVSCPRTVIAWDFRYRLLPEQFSGKARLLRRASYAVGFRQAKGVVCISDRTRRDLLTFHRRLAKVPVKVSHLGADHVDNWPVRPKGRPYALAFGHFPNKNVDLVLQGWKQWTEQAGPEDVLALRVVGVPDTDRAALEERVESLGLQDVVTIQSWLSKESFREEFASSNLVVFPSDFEGFGLPAVEAMRLGIPLVITPEPALLEVTAGHATVVDGSGPSALTRAVTTARLKTPEDIAAAKQYATAFTWSNFAAGVRTTLLETMEPAPQRRPVWARTPARLAGSVVAATFAFSGVAAAAYALTTPSHAAPTSQTETTSTAGAAASPAGTKTSGGAAGATHTGSTTNAQGSTGTNPGAASSGSGSSNSASGSGGGSVQPTLPTLPSTGVTPPSVTVPTVPPTVTVPSTVCTTSTTVGTTVVSTPCKVSVP